jgi:polyisoprenoid-binding protein YceI
VRWIAQQEAIVRASRLLVPLMLGTALIQPASAAVDLADAAGRYTIGASGSRIGFAIAQMAGRGLSGEFGNFSGSIRIDAKDVSRSEVQISIYPASVSTGQNRVDKFLRSNAVFDTAKEEVITFRSTTVAQQNDETALVTGQLTARGKTHAEKFNVRLESVSKGGIVFHVTGKVLRSRYGMDVGTPIYSNVVDFDMRLMAKRR